MVGFVCWSTRSAIISASPDSDVPHVFSERDTITARSPDALEQVGQHVLGDHVGHLVRHAGHRVDDLLHAVAASTSHRSPGAVPIGFGMTSPPFGTSAWRRLFSGNGRPRPPKMRGSAR